MPKTRSLLRRRHGSGDRMYQVERGSHDFGLEVLQSGVRPSMRPKVQDMTALILVRKARLVNARIMSGQLLSHALVEDGHHRQIFHMERLNIENKLLLSTSITP